MSYPKRGSELIRGDRGSALILALMVMLILTFMGLTLLALTETEMQLGNNERIDSELFYATESGKEVAKARIQDGAVVPTTFLIRNPTSASSIGGGGGGASGSLSTAAPFEIGYRVGLSRAVVIRYSPCDFCPSNEDEESWSYRVSYLVYSRGTRRDWRGADPDALVADANKAIQAQKIIGVVIDFQPAEMPLVEAFAAGDEGLGIGELGRSEDHINTIAPAG